MLDPETGKIFGAALAVQVPGPLTDRISEIARKHDMYIIAPIYEMDGDAVYNTAVVFDRNGNIMGKHRKTILPVMETWLVSAGDELEVFETDFGTIAIATCLELFYPEISTIYALKGADIIFNPLQLLSYPWESHHNPVSLRPPCERQDHPKDQSVVLRGYSHNTVSGRSDHNAHGIMG